MAGAVAAAAVVGAAVARPGAAAEAAPVRIGIVDLQAVLNQSRVGQAAKARVRAEAEQKQKEVQARERDLVRMREELEKQAAVLSEAGRKEKEEALRRSFRDLQRFADDSERDLQKREREMVNDILREITAVVRGYALEKAYGLILERNQAGVIFGADGVDLTREILERFNARR
jgi:outer membrane protein